MKLKVCGLKHEQNIQEVDSLSPDFLGFIFYDKSPRDVQDGIEEEKLCSLSTQAEKVGVFVDRPIEDLLDKCKKYGLKTVQLHGEESPEYCKTLLDRGLSVIKTFGINNDFDFKYLEKYHGTCDYFLFDTKGRKKGGNGYAFDWSVLLFYDQKTPFFLSGGLGLNNIKNLNQLSSLNLAGVDVNSKFEIEPGLKNIEMLRELKRKIDELKAIGV